MVLFLIAFIFIIIIIAAVVIAIIIIAVIIMIVLMYIFYYYYFVMYLSISLLVFVIHLLFYNILSLFTFFCHHTLVRFTCPPELPLFSSYLPNSPSQTSPFHVSIILSGIFFLCFSCNSPSRFRLFIVASFYPSLPLFSPPMSSYFPYPLMRPPYPPPKRPPPLPLPEI